MRIKLALTVSFTLLFSLFVKGEDSEAILSQIRDYQSKTEEIRKKITHEQQKATADSIAFSEYVTDYENRALSLQQERDSLNALVERLNERRGSLEAQSGVIQARSTNYRAQTRSLLHAIRDNCRQFHDSLQHLALFNMDRQLHALRFLEGELAAGTVDAVEGLERYWQIVGQIEQASQKIETWSGSSPHAAVSGEVTFLRLRFVWLAFINNDNSKGYLWDSSNDEWSMIENASDIVEIREASNLISGSAAPRLVKLPFSHTISATEKESD
ncbi:DUF3450 family protein [Chitinispirillales bacterium ANBcel5]|uniref:DUF3450 family protein n=1 Tax=Cellulosispirillum alkaliphilum TaxID=3039283 RepID=UPI002A570A41|nr:DUF3450 family protein [Chitinispirillales bacterium ANBcel5]